ncbi:hypothetical protein CEUSTIGMA_g2882.t1 [Chlamydomonas eustigma]|uniref:Uncharacterized protein n=1 Tax=Chlamydomonas eustigma TaxID=1157962 RepID=A0A250WX66_9CHLO|nr:hypothetical protein CEUSTIGMA_g2882.t1 [Chlamydomonas eustigma]|eukprot:GAX75438.1 hypothetical protein CEUSTIGMA_g2882.t1 [Chlamydomonas eustigma]
MVLKEDLKLNRQLQNSYFQSWRLAPSPGVISQHEISLPGHVATINVSATDYLHTRHATLRNHILEVAEGTHRRYFSFLRGQSTRFLLLTEIVLCQAASITEDAFKLKKIAEIQDYAKVPPGSGFSSGSNLDPSLALVDTSLIKDKPSFIALSSALHHSLLVTSGDGSMVIVHNTSSHDGSMMVTEAVYPLRLDLPLTGHRPYVIEAAYMLSSGHLRCVLWAATDQAEGGRRPRSCCQTYLVTISIVIQPATEGQQAPHHALRLQVESVVLLRHSSMPPHFTICNPQQDSVLMGLDPGSCNEEDARNTAEGNQVIHINCHKDDAGPGNNDDDDSDIDPRTLQEAAARLAKYTSEEPMESNPPHQHWTDVYKESGPDGVGDMGSEESMDMLLIRMSGFVEEDQLPLAHTSGVTAATPKPEASWHLSCGAARLLSSESAAAGGVIGFCDDVDCAVVTVSWPPHRTHPQVLHEAYIPALAYVAAGKIHKKHLILGAAHSKISAVLVEGQKMYYVYQKVLGNQASGHQEVLAMNLEAGESVLGARLVDSATMGELPTASKDNGIQYLLLLTQYNY